MEQMEEKGEKIPKRLQKAKIFTYYAVETTYPGDYIPVDEDNYKEALELAEK